MVQWGIAGDPAVSAKWRGQQLQDDPVVESNTKGTLSFAAAGANSRTMQVFINLADNTNLDRQKFQVFGRVTAGFESTVEKFEDKYRNVNVKQGVAMTHGNIYFEENLPDLDYIYTATVL